MTKDEVLEKSFKIKKKNGTEVKRRLTEKERMRVVAAYLDCGAYQTTAKKFGLTSRAVKLIVESEPDFVALYNKKREEEMAELFGVISAKSGKFAEFCEIFFDKLADPVIINRLAAMDLEKLTRVFGITLDKFAMVRQVTGSNSENSDVVDKIEIVVRRRQETDEL